MRVVQVMALVTAVREYKVCIWAKERDCSNENDTYFGCLVCDLGSYI